MIFLLGLTFIANRRSELLFLYPKNTLPKAPRLIGLIMEKSVIHGTWKKHMKFLNIFFYGIFGYFLGRVNEGILDALRTNISSFGSGFGICRVRKILETRNETTNYYYYE